MSGISFITACLVLQSTNLMATYNNGFAGIGATLTNSDTFMDLVIDGVNVALNSRILVIGQQIEYENGIYTVTDTGSTSTAWVLTRSTDYDTPSEIRPFDVVPITDGMQYSGLSWIQTSIVNNIGTDPIEFDSFISTSSIVLPLNIEFDEWASQIRIDLPNVVFPVASPIEEWREWASQVVYSNNLPNVPLPTDICYPNNEDWRKWGAYFINNVYD